MKRVIVVVLGLAVAFGQVPQSKVSNDSKVQQQQNKVELTEYQLQQHKIIALIKKLAEPYGLAETITVIARIESNFGLYVVNLNEGSCGITQINIKTYIARHKIENTPFNRNKACSDLVNSMELSIANSIEELLYWKQQFCNKATGECTKRQFQNVVRAYNGGFKGYKNKKTAEYWEKFKAYHKELYPAELKTNFKQRQK